MRRYGDGKTYAAADVPAEARVGLAQLRARELASRRHAERARMARLYPRLLLAARNAVAVHRCGPSWHAELFEALDELGKTVEDCK